MTRRHLLPNALTIKNIQNGTVKSCLKNVEKTLPNMPEIPKYLRVNGGASDHPKHDSTLPGLAVEFWFHLGKVVSELALAFLMWHSSCTKICIYILFSLFSKLAKIKWERSPTQLYVTFQGKRLSFLSISEMLRQTNGFKTLSQLHERFIGQSAVHLQLIKF